MIRNILFDVDGVLLSEERYFDASALTVWEMIHSPHYLGQAPDQFKTDYSDSEIIDIRRQVFENDLVLKFLKSRGLNANWDMIYITFSYQLIYLLSQIKNDEFTRIEKWLSSEMNRQTLLEIKEVLNHYSVQLSFTSLLDDFKDYSQTKQELFLALDALAEKKLGVSSTSFQKKGTLWSVCEHCSQEWYVGDQNIITSTGLPAVQTGKQGFLADEKTLALPEEIRDLFQALKEAGISIGIGTGRPKLETIEPFKALNWLPIFDENHIVTADDVLAAEVKHPDRAPLAKPNPFTYLLALAGNNSTAESIIETTLPLSNGEEVLIVGDSLADLLAAQKMGCRFAAVLTGLSGKDARAEFERHHAEFILDSVLEIKELVNSVVESES